MKYEKTIYAIGTLLIVAGAIMKILHLPSGNPVLLFGFLVTSVFQTWHVAQLKRRIEELERNNA